MRDLLKSAAPACTCGEGVQRIEHTWGRDEDDNWRVTAYAVCSAGCRVVVVPFPPDATDENRKDGS